MIKPVPAGRLSCNANLVSYSYVLHCEVIKFEKRSDHIGIKETLPD